MAAATAWTFPAACCSIAGSSPILASSSCLRLPNIDLSSDSVEHAGFLGGELRLGQDARVAELAQTLEVIERIGLAGASAGRGGGGRARCGPRSLGRRREARDELVHRPELFPWDLHPVAVDLDGDVG